MPWFMAVTAFTDEKTGVQKQVTVKQVQVHIGLRGKTPLILFMQDSLYRSIRQGRGCLEPHVRSLKILLACNVWVTYG